MNDRDLCLEVVSRLCRPLRYIRRWISRKLLEIEAWFQRTTNRKWHMGYQMVTWPMTSHDPQMCFTVGYPSDSSASCFALLHTFSGRLQAGHVSADTNTWQLGHDEPRSSLLLTQLTVSFVQHEHNNSPYRQSRRCQDSRWRIRVWLRL